MKPKNLKRSKRSGFTVLEAITAAAMTVLVISGAVGTMLMGLRSWTQGQGQVEAELDAQQAMRAVTRELRECMNLTVDADGRGLSYRLPSRDGNGEFIVPPIWDGVTRRISLVENNRGRFDLSIGTIGQMTRLSRGIVLTNPEQLNAAYRPFEAGPGTIKRSITIMFVSNSLAAKDQITYSRNREVLYLRNVPSLTK